VKQNTGAGTLQVCQGGKGPLTKVLLNLTMKRHPSHVNSNLEANNLMKSNVQWSSQWLRSQFLIAHNTLNSTMSP